MASSKGCLIDIVVITIRGWSQRGISVVTMVHVEVECMVFLGFDPPTLQIWGYLCLYQNFKVTAFVGNKGKMTPHVGHKADFYHPFWGIFQRNRLPLLVGRTTLVLLCPSLVKMNTLLKFGRWLKITVFFKRNFKGDDH
jgi:hypothetical protein